MTWRVRGTAPHIAGLLPGSSGMPAAFLDVDRSDLQGAFMNMQRLISRSIPLTTALLLAAAPTLSAQWDRDRSSDPQGRRLFDWTGRVDREIQIVMRGDDVWTRD